MAPPKGNLNAVRHGITAGSLPKGCAYIARQAQQLLKALEDAVQARYTQVTVTKAAIISTAVRAEQNVLLYQRYLRKVELNPDQYLKFLEKRLSASETRDRAILALQLDDDSDALDLYGRHFRTALSPPPALANDSPAADTDHPGAVQPCNVAHDVAVTASEPADAEGHSAPTGRPNGQQAATSDAAAADAPSAGAAPPEPTNHEDRAVVFTE